LKKVHRLWREAGLKVPFRKRKNRRAGHGVAMGAHHPIDANVTWAMDFQFDATGDGKVLKLLNIIDEYSREYLATLVDRSIDAEGVISALDGIVAERGTPVYIRMDNGPEFISHALERWDKEMGVTLYFIDPGSPFPKWKVRVVQLKTPRRTLERRTVHLSHRGPTLD
jgi:putative transposase